MAAARNRLRKWENALDGLPEGPVELSTLERSFPGITEDNGAFTAHLETAKLAIALKRRILVLQAVEHAQLDGTGNPFTSFLSGLRDDEQRVDELESGINIVLLRLSALELKRPAGLLKKVHYSPSDVDDLLAAAYRLRSFSGELNGAAGKADVMIDIERNRDGSVVVFPAEAVSQ